MNIIKCYKCDKCDQEFDNFQAKANHVRWNHKTQKYSEEGLRLIRESVKRTAIKIYGEKKFVISNKKCECGISFEHHFISNRKHWDNKYCSRKCAAKFSLTEESKNKIRKWHKEHPEHYENYRLSAMNSHNSRFSSKAERALCAALLRISEGGFKRHYFVKTQELNFDVDITTKDKRVWIESDGEWHFRQVHKGHNFKLTQLRDRIEENEAIIKMCF